MLPVCDHYAGVEARMRKALALQAELGLAVDAGAPLRQLEQPGDEIEVLFDAQVFVQAELLGHVADLALDLGGLAAEVQAQHPAPLEFDVLGIPKRDFTPQDTVAISGYLAYSFAAAFKTEPVMTFIRDQLGPEYLRAFDVDWHPEGVLTPIAGMTPDAWNSLQRVAGVSLQASELGGIPLLEGSNAWAVSGRRTASPSVRPSSPSFSARIRARWTTRSA